MKKAVILIVDDSRVNNVLVKEILEPEYTVIAFQNPLALLRYLNQHPADMVISDLMMPEMSGYELIHEIKTLNPNLPVLILSAIEESEMIEEAWEKGADAFLNKPINIPNLLNKIKTLLHSYLIC